MKNNLWSNLSSKNYTSSEIYTFIKSYAQVVSGVDIPEAFNSSMLHLAARSGDVDLIKKVLIYEHIDINLQDKNGWTALHIAAFFGHKDMYEFLIKKGANINEKTSDANDHEIMSMNIAIDKEYTDSSLLGNENNED